MNEVKTALLNLLKVKSIVTIILTLVFVYQLVCKSVSEEFMSVYIMVISFYFGTQYQKGVNSDVPSVNNN